MAITPANYGPPQIEHEGLRAFIEAAIPIPEEEPGVRGMSQELVAERFEVIFKEKIMALREAGQKEYAHEEDNAFANFDRVAQDLGLSREEVLWVYARKHIDGITAYLRGHRSQREDVRGRITDLIVYALLLHCMIDVRETEDV